jgi:hypothetical protein
MKMKISLCSTVDLKKGYYPFECQECGHRGCSFELGWDGPGPQGEMDGNVYCPICGCTNIKETSNDA